jgi:hypothetical protein
MPSEPKYWFPAKRYGWGWGPPSSWHGWVVLISYFGLLAVDGLVFRPDLDLHLFLAVVTLLSVLLMPSVGAKGNRLGGVRGKIEVPHTNSMEVSSLTLRRADAPTPLPRQERPDSDAQNTIDRTFVRTAGTCFTAPADFKIAWGIALLCKTARPDQCDHERWLLSTRSRR